MILFQTVINFIEGFLFSFFFAKCFNLKKLFVLITTIFQVIIFTVAAQIGHEGVDLNIAIIMTMFLSTCIVTKKVKFNYLYLAILYDAVILACALLAMYICIKIPESIFYYCGCIVAKSLQVITTCFLINKKNLLFKNFSFQTGWTSLGLYFLVGTNLSACSMAIVSAYDPMLSFTIITLATIGIVFFIGYAIDELEKLNLQKQEYIRIEEAKKANAEKESLLKRLKYDIEETDHRISYILIQLENYFKEGQMDEVEALLSKYRQLTTHHHLVAETGNKIFDLLYSTKINNYVMEGKQISSTIFISRSDFYNKHEFIDLMLDFIGYFKSCDSFTVSIDEVNRLVRIRILYKGGEIDKEGIIRFFESIPYENYKYNLENAEEKGIRLIVPMDNLND